MGSILIKAFDFNNSLFDSFFKSKFMFESGCLRSELLFTSGADYYEWSIV